MIKLFHHNLKVEFKVIQKPRPTGNEIKNMSAGVLKIVLHSELYEGMEMGEQKVISKNMMLEQQPQYAWQKNTMLEGGEWLVGSLFGSIESALGIMGHDYLYSIMLVKIAPQDIPCELLFASNLQRVSGQLLLPKSRYSLT